MLLVVVLAVLGTVLSFIMGVEQPSCCCLFFYLSVVLVNYWHAMFG